MPFKMQQKWHRQPLFPHKFYSVTTGKAGKKKHASAEWIKNVFWTRCKAFEFKGTISVFIHILCVIFCFSCCPWRRQCAFCWNIAFLGCFYWNSFLSFPFTFFRSLYNCQPSFLLLFHIITSHMSQLHFLISIIQEIMSSFICIILWHANLSHLI